MYKPLPRFVTIQTSDIHGLGLASKVSLPPEYIIGLSHIIDERFENELIRTPLGGFINHSTHPTCTLQYDEEFVWLKTCTVVYEGTELTVDYEKHGVHYLKENNGKKN